MERDERGEEAPHPVCALLVSLLRYAEFVVYLIWPTLNKFEYSSPSTRTSTEYENFELWVILGMSGVSLVILSRMSPLQVDGPSQCTFDFAKP